MLWRQGYSFNSFELRILLDPKVLRTKMQVNKDIFYDIDKGKEYRFICLCNKVWNSNHRLKCSTCSVKHLRLFLKKTWNLLLKRIIWCCKIYHRYWNNKNLLKEPEKIWNSTNYRRYVGQLLTSKNKPR